jgi:serine protease AprX
MPDPTKIHPRLAERLQVQARAMLATPEPLPVIVHYHFPVIGIAEAIQGVVATTRTYRLIAASAHLALPSAINALTERDQVAMIWYDEPVHTMLDASVPLIDVPQVWQADVTGRGIKVAIVDTGIDPNHPDFAGRIVQSKDFTGEGDVDKNGHGTHVAGIVGGSGAASQGKYRGVAPDCSFYIAKVLRANGSGRTSDVMSGVEWSVEQGAQVVNLSLGSDGACDGTDALSVLCDAAVARGVVLCVAAGNAGPGVSTVGSPGCAKTVITVGATTKSDQVASFSSRGPTSDGRIKPDVCFPGVSIVACRASGTSMGTPVDVWYTSASGTSMATPHATGACALLLQAKPGLAPQQIKEILMNTAKDLGQDANVQGKGRAQVFAAYQNALGQEPQPQPPAPTPPGTGCLAVLQRWLGWGS